MSGLPGLTLKDIYGDTSGPAPEVQAAVTASRQLPGISLKDLGMERPPKELPFAEGATVEVPFPFREPIKGTVGPSAARFLAGAGKRMADVARRARQIYGDEAVQREIDEAAQLDRPLMETTAGQLGYAAPDVVLGMQPQSLPLKALTAAVFGAASGAATPLTSEELARGSQVLNPAIGAIGGAAGQKLLGGVATAIGKTSNVLPNALAMGANRLMPQGRKVPVPGVPFRDPAIQQAYRQAQQQGVRTSIGDLEPHGAFRGLEDTLEGVLPERREFMFKQQDDLRNMLERTQGAVDKPITDQAGNVIPNSYAMAQGVKDAYAAAKAQARTLFNDVEQLAAKPGVQPIIPAQTYHEAKRLAAERPEFFKELQDNGLWKKVLGIEKDAGPQSSIILQPNGQPFKKAQQLDFSEVKALRSRLGSEWRSARGQDPEKARMMSVLLRALDNDVDAWGQNTGNKALNTAYADARAFYRENVVPFTDPLANPSKSPLFSNIALKDKVDAETIPRGVFKEGRQQLAQDFMDLSTPQGQQAAKNELIDEVIGAGLNPNTETGLSTALIRQSARSKAPGAAVFSPDEQTAINQAVDTLRTTRRAAGMSDTPPKTGMRIGPWAAMGAVGGSSVPLYYGLNALAGDELSPAERVATSFVLYPAAALALAKGGLKYSQSGLGQKFHFAEPDAMMPAIGGLQTLLRQGGKGLGSRTAGGLQQYGATYPSIMRGTYEDQEE